MEKQKKIIKNKAWKIRNPSDFKVAEKKKNPDLSEIKPLKITVRILNERDIEDRNYLKEPQV